AGVHDSGKTHKDMKITNRGRRELRWALVEAAWRAVGMSPFWKAEYEKYLSRLRKKNQAIVVTPAPAAGAVSHGNCWLRSGMGSARKSPMFMPARKPWLIKCCCCPGA
ncbi:MAG: IS110 family transposase, partial [Anaerolineae bacterium]|nr:IS110 family transposase [Anaerolineae bacterium]